MTYASPGGMLHYADVPVGRHLPDGRVSLAVPAGALTPSSGAGSRAGETTQFVKNMALYSYEAMVASATETSTEDPLVYGVGLFADMPLTVTYTFCFCSDQQDSTLPDRGDGEHTPGSIAVLA